MRTIKFRAWDNDKKEMLDIIDGYELRIMADSSVMIARMGFPTNSKKYHLMQYSGLLDKHGIEIYEGDLVRATRKNKKGVIKEIISPVVFHHGHFMLVKSKTNKKWRSLGCVENKDVLEVVGNIYEDKLLTVK
jgi:uncharacterized phage protein (TIGR01671 family)